MSDWEVVPQAESDWAIVPEAHGEPMEEGGPESFLSLETFKPSKGQRKFKNQTGPIEQVRRDLDPSRVWVPEDAGEAAAAPVLSIADRATLGGLGGLLRAATRINEATGTTEPTLASRSLKAIEGYRRMHPTLSQYTDLPSYVGPGGPRALAAGVEMALPRVAHPLAQAARATLGAGLSSAGVAGTEAAMGGADTEEVLRETGRGFVGGTAVGAPLATGSALARGASGAILRSRGAKAREYLESRGQPLTAADTSDAAIGAAAQRADDAVKSRLEAYRGEVASQPYEEAIAKISPQQANALVDATSIYTSLLKAAQDPGNLQVADKLNSLVNMFERRGGTGPVLMSESQLNGLRRSLAGIAGIGETTAGKLDPLRRAYAQTKAIVDEGPYAEANRIYSEGLDDLGESLDMVGLKRTTRPDEPITGNLRVASQRQGQNTVTAGADTERLDIGALKAKHPELANVIDEPEIIRNQGDLAFTATGPHHGGLIERLAGSMPIPIALAAAAAGHGMKGLLGAAALAAFQNRNAIAGRVLYTPAQQAQIAAQLMLSGVPAAATPGREMIQDGR